MNALSPYRVPGERAAEPLALPLALVAVAVADDDSDAEIAPIACGIAAPTDAAPVDAKHALRDAAFAGLMAFVVLLGLAGGAVVVVLVTSWLLHPFG